MSEAAAHFAPPAGTPGALPHGGTSIRPAVAEDAGAIHRLVRESEELEPNSLYAYLLLCTHFAGTCLVAHESNGTLVGFVAAYRPPDQPDVVFVWQIGVAAAQRGNGLGAKLLDVLIHQPSCADVRFLEATVTPSNVASQRLFRGLARTNDTPCVVRPFFTAEHFAPDTHEDEDLYRIGPLPHPNLPGERC